MEKAGLLVWCLTLMLTWSQTKPSLASEEVELGYILAYLQTVDIDLKVIKYLQDTDFVLMFFYKQSHIEADYIFQVVKNSVDQLGRVFPKMQFEVIDTDEELELAYHYEIVMHCKIFLKFSDTTTLEYPSRIVKETPLISWIFENVKNQTINTPRLQKESKRGEDPSGHEEELEGIDPELYPIHIDIDDL